MLNDHDWRTYSVAIEIPRQEEMMSAHMQALVDAEMQGCDEALRHSITVDMFADGYLGMSLGEECFDASCDHCCGFWDSLFASQEEADQWLMQHRAVCLQITPPTGA